ncbi:MAG TPA: hypothetical protein VFR90_12120 [Methylibium sp.]|uniref:hypothetical protein n=1 Tax=Methylibium sp. TaxID=2067992 RepID=UPI002DBF6907|nr:hypothetical protein [Methylibium sp.]HEU4459861.1 hypothetical protein [Methylibium sp.]
MTNLKLQALAAATCAVLMAAAAQAKLPPLSPEAQAKADEAKAKTAWSEKVAAFKLCQSMERTAAQYFKTTGKDPKTAQPTPPCSDPGAFVYAPAAAPAPTPPLEAAGAHSPPQPAATPPNSKLTDAEQKGGAKK